MLNVVFDFGNVLNHWRPEDVLLPFFDDPADLHPTLDRIGFWDWNLEQDRGRDWDEAVAVAKAHHPKDAHLFRAYREGLAEAHAETIEQSLDIVHHLHAEGVPLYAITNASIETVPLLERLHGYPSLFRDVVISAEVGLIKPDPEIFRVFLSRNGLAAETCLFIDDVAANVDGARSVGMKGIRFKSPDDLIASLRSHGLPL